MNQVCEEKGIIREGKIGEAASRLIEAKGLLEIGTKILKKDPNFLLKKRHQNAK